jgi:uncharacterized protein
MPEVRFAVRLTPRGGTDRVDGVSPDGALLVRVAAPPADGAANAALLVLLSRELGSPRTSVRLALGATSRRKMIAIEGLAAGVLEERWPGLAITTPSRRGGGRG